MINSIQERKEIMDKLREAVKARYTYRQIASRIGNSAGWVGQCLRGNYESYHLPHKLADSLVGLGFDDAASLKITYAPYAPQNYQKRLDRGYPDQDEIDQAFANMPKLPLAKIGSSND